MTKRQPYCSSCRHGEINCPADVQVSGKTPEGRPYRANVCLGHLDVLETSGYDVRLTAYFSDDPEVLGYKADALWARYEAAKARAKLLQYGTPARVHATNAALKLHEQWLAIAPAAH